MDIVRGIFELHLEVTDIKKSMEFYGNKLGFKLGLYEEGRKRAFYLIEQEQLSMFSIVERSNPNLRHFAFRVNFEDLNKMSSTLSEKGIELVPGWTGASPDEPIVFPWIPAASVFFNDPDGNRIELITILPDSPRPDIEKPYVMYSEWLQLNN